MLAIIFIAVSVFAALNNGSTIEIDEVPKCSEEIDDIYYEICGLEADVHVQKMLTDSIKKELKK